MSDVNKLVKEILDLSGKINGPERDPGDITIRIQDDAPLVTVHQGDWDASIYTLLDQDPFVLTGIGNEIVSALEDHITKLKTVLENIETKNL
jgi:hypothetical protein